MDETLGTDAVGEVLRRVAHRTGRSLSDVRTEAQADLKEIAAVPAGRVSLAAWGRFCRWMIRAYHLDYRPEEVRALHQLNETAALVFLPNHRSYLDPLILRSVLSAHAFPQNHMLGGDNLAFWPLSAIGRGNGFVFIRRDFRGDDVYRAVLRGYVAHLMKERQNLEWYMEGGRTRTGRLRAPRLGLLRYVMDAFEPEHDVQIVPTSIIYDEQVEVSAISAEEMGETKKAESLGWLYRLGRGQSRRLGSAYIRFGEPLSLRDAISLTADEDGELRPRLAVAKVALETARRINAITPITPSALITFALLDNPDRAITVEAGCTILAPLMDYIDRRGLPRPDGLDLGSADAISDTFERLVGGNIVSCYARGAQAVYWVEESNRHEAAFYCNSMAHLLVARAITELALLQAAQEHARDIRATTWLHARRLKGLLRFEFILPSTAQFAGQVADEVTLLQTEGQQDTLTPEAVLRCLNDAELLVAHRVIGPILAAYSLLADELTGMEEQLADEKTLVDRCHVLARQHWLQRTLPCVESISRDYFRNASRIAKKMDLLDSQAPAMAQRRQAFADELKQLVDQLAKLRHLAQAASRLHPKDRTLSGQGDHVA